MPFQLNVRKRAYEASTTTTSSSSRRFQAPIPSFEPVSWPPNISTAVTHKSNGDTPKDNLASDNVNYGDFLCEEGITDEVDKPILLLQSSDDSPVSSPSSVVSIHWSDDDDDDDDDDDKIKNDDAHTDDDDEFLPTAFPKRTTPLDTLKHSCKKLPSPVVQKENIIDETIQGDGDNTSCMVLKREIEPIKMITTSSSLPQETKDAAAISESTFKNKVDPSSSQIPPAFSTSGSFIQCDAPPPAPSKTSVPLMGDEDTSMKANAVALNTSKRLQRKRKKPLSPEKKVAVSFMDTTHAQLLILSKSQMNTLNRPSSAATLSSKNYNNNTSRRIQSSTKGSSESQSLSSVPGCLLCHFCPCRHLSKQEKKRLVASTASVLHVDPLSSMNFTNMTPLTALTKHAQIDHNHTDALMQVQVDSKVSETSTTTNHISRSRNHNVDDDNNNNNNNNNELWKQYQDMEIQYISRIRRLEQTIAWFDHLAYKAAQDLKRVRGKIVKLAQHAQEKKNMKNIDLGSSDEEDQEEEDVQETLKTNDDKQDNKRKVKWNNQYLDCNDFDWEDPTNFPSKLSMDVTTEVKTKLFTFRKKKQPTLTQMFATHEDSDKCTDDTNQENTTCALWNASKKYTFLHNKDIPVDIQEVINQQDTVDSYDANVVNFLEEINGNTIEMHNESGMDHLMALFIESTD